MNIQQIAKLAGVSVSTVSKVMNGKDKDISEKTRKNVLKIIEDNGYMPYARFRVKEGLLNRLIGLIIERENPYYSEIVASAEKALRERRFYPVVCSVGSDRKEVENALSELKKRGVAGALIDGPHAVASGADECKIVYLTHTDPAESGQKNTFYYQRYDAGKMAAEALLEAGHRKISCLLWDTERMILDGAEAALKEWDHAGGPAAFYLGKNLEDMRENALEICIGDHATAVICSDAEIAGLVLEYARRTGLKVPDECSVICTRDQKMLRHLAGGITAVHYPVERMAEDAVSHLIRMIEEKQENAIARRFPPELRERVSIRNIREKKTGKKIIVVGSMNMDSSIEGVLTPVNGETVIATNILMMPGGKGANQAVGVGRLGGEAYMIGRIGKDADGRRIYKSLTDNGVHNDGVEFDEYAASGKAFVHIDKNGENAIVVYRGANGNLDEAQLRRHKELFRGAKYCLLSSEISREAMVEVKNICRTYGTEIILKPSAIEAIGEDFFEGIEYLVPNEKEMERLCPDRRLPMEEKAENILGLGVKNVIVTRGKRGAYLRNREHSIHFDGNPFTAIDTTGGADAFISAMAVSLCEGRDLIYSIIYASYTAGITVTRYGVQDAMPDKKTMRIYMDAIERQYIKSKNGGGEE